MGNYSPDRQTALERLLLAAAASWQQGRFVVAGPQFPASITWPANTQRIEHSPRSAIAVFTLRSALPWT